MRNITIEDLMPFDYSLDSKLEEFERLKFKFNINGLEKLIKSGISGEDIVISSISLEIKRYISDRIRSYLNSSSISQYFHFKENLSDQVIRLLTMYGQSVYLSSGSQISMELQSNPNFHFKTQPVNIYTSSASIFGLDIVIDPLLTDHEIIYLLDSISVNILNIMFDVGESSVSFDFAFKVKNFSTIAIVENEKSKHWGGIVKLQRDSKIDKII